MKKTLSPFLKDFLGKLPVFIFCVAFISMHNYIFGQENSIIAVIILTGLFIFMRGDFGYNAKQAAVAIVFLFAVMVVGSRAALIHPVIGLFVNFIVINLMLILSCHNLTQGNHVPFLMGYLFCQGYDVGGQAYGYRLISIVIGSIIIAIIYYIFNRKKEYKRSIKDLFLEMDIHSIRTQWYVRMSVTLTLTMFVCNVLSYPRTLWVALAVLSLTTPFEDEHYQRRRARIPAAIIGTVIFYVMFVLVIPEQYQAPVVLAAGFAAMFIKSYFVKSIYNSFSALGTAVILFPTKEALYLRVISNIIGTVVALCSYYVFRFIFGRALKEQRQ